jgi:type I restriction enzyme S subunit
MGAAERLERTTFAQLISDGSLEIGDGYRAKNEELGGDGLIFLRAGHMTDTHIDFMGVERFRAELEPRVHSKLAKPGDAVITTKGNSTGRTAFVSQSMPPFVYSPHLSYWRSLDASRIASGFLRYWCKGPEFSVQLAGMKASTDMAPYLSLVDQKRLEITLPPPDEQRAIAHILGTLDDKIELNRRMNETLEAMARALFKSWFVDFDPVRAKAEGRDPGLPKPLADLFPARLVDSDLGEIPEGWEVGTLAGMSALNPEVWSKQTRPPEINYVDLSSTKWGRIEAVTAHEAADAPSRAQRVLRPGDTIVGTVRPGNGSYAFILEAGLTGSTGFAALRPRIPQYAEFIYLAGTAAENIDALAHLADGGAYPAVRPEIVAATPVVCPDDTVLGRFSLAVGPLLSRIAHSQNESRTLATLRDTLLPKLISGELLVKDAERFIGSAV